VSFAPDITEQVARARSDLRMGVPIVLQSPGESGGLLVLAVETLTSARLAEVQSKEEEAIVVITRRRAQTLKTHAYDDDVARLTLPTSAGLQWVQALADPADDLRAPMKGPLRSVRGGDAVLHRAAITLAKASRLLPATACFTGDVLGSLKCDCGPQLRGALTAMGDAGEGVLLYLNQEGRGIGLANKMRAYALQDQGFDTVEANHRLGFEDDERDFRIGAEILKRMGFTAVRLMTNNPAKIARMEGAGVTVAERVPLKVGVNPINQAYLATKAAKSGHLL